MKTELKPPIDLFCKTPMALIRRIRELEAIIAKADGTAVDGSAMRFEAKEKPPERG